MTKTRMQAFSAAAKLGIEIDCYNTSKKHDVTMWAPDGKKFAGSGCACFSLSWYAGGDIGKFWQELVNEMELDDEV